jgi:hypothetical protein
MMAVYSEAVASFTCCFLLPWIRQNLVERGGRGAHTSSSLIQAVLKLPPQCATGFPSPVFIAVSDLQSLGHGKEFNHREDQIAGSVFRGRGLAGHHGPSRRHNVRHGNEESGEENATC